MCLQRTALKLLLLMLLWVKSLLGVSYTSTRSMASNA